MGQKILMTPLILSEGSHTLHDLQKLKESQPIWKENDIYEAQLRELFEITHPTLIGTKEFEKQRTLFIQQRTTQKQTHLRGSWVYFPWSGRLVHMLGKEEYTALRTNRNRNLITQEEQKKLLDFCVGIVGLSVGSNVATTLTYSGIANIMKLAEFDTLETTNLNRMRGRIDQIGTEKVDITAQQIYEANPYAKLSLFSQGIDKNILFEFVLQDPKPKLIFEIIDNFEMKIHLRNLAREQGIPIIMVTNLGDRVLMDIERYDLSKNTEFFNGRAGKLPQDLLRKPDITPEDKHRYAVELAGVTHIPQRAMDSVKEIGKTLVGRPQLASTVTTASGFCSYLARKIALAEPLPSCSWLVDLDHVITEANAL
jgi:hypothetical protein